MKLVKLISLLMVVGYLTACAAQPQMMPTAEFAPVQPIPAHKPKQVTGSIFTNGQAFYTLMFLTLVDIKVVLDGQTTRLASIY